MHEHADRAGRHGRGADGRVQHAERRDRDADEVIKQRPRQVLADGADGRARDVKQLRQLLEVAGRQQDARRLDGDVRPAAHGDRAVRHGERRRVVDAVADHADRLALRAARPAASRAHGPAAPRTRRTPCPGFSARCLSFASPPCQKRSAQPALPLKNHQASSPASSRFCLNSLRFLIAVMHAGMATAGRSSSSAQSIQSMPLMN